MTSLIFVVLLGILVAAALVSLNIWFKSYNRSKEKSRLLKSLEKARQRHNFIIDTHDLLHKKIIALDRLNRRLLLIDRSRRSEKVHIIDLREVFSCHLLNNRNTPDRHTRNISLEFIFKEMNKLALYLPFFDESHNRLHDKLRLARKAEYWEKNINLHKRL